MRSRTTQKEDEAEGVSGIVEQGLSQEEATGAKDLCAETVDGTRGLRFDLVENITLKDEGDKWALVADCVGREVRDGGWYDQGWTYV